tara:strand:- start:1115 stop:2059 length:945 start_codon:yes stop_codon:yes gene_type:complete
MHSIEKVYDTLIPFLSTLKVVKLEMPYKSKGLVKRIGNIFYTAFNQATINHISGDINYVNIFMKKKNTILTIHDIYPIYRSKGVKKIVLQFFWFTIPIQKSKKIIAVSEFTKSEILKHFNHSKGKIHVIYNCISPQFKYNKHTFNKTKPTILQIGTKDNKNLGNLLEAIKGLKIKLVIVGSLSRVQIITLNKYNIDYQNFKDITDEALIRMYEKSDILSFISTYEGFGLPIIEAQAIGRVVITSNIASMPEVAGEGALLVNPYSIDDIRNGIKELINNDGLRVTYINKGFENVKRFEPQKIAKQYIEVYNKVAN